MTDTQAATPRTIEELLAQYTKHSVEHEAILAAVAICEASHKAEIASLQSQVRRLEAALEKIAEHQLSLDRGAFVAGCMQDIAREALSGETP